LNLAGKTGAKRDMILISPLIEFRFGALHVEKAKMVKTGEESLAETGLRSYIYYGRANARWWFKSTGIKWLKSPKRTHDL